MILDTRTLIVISFLNLLVVGTLIWTGTLGSADRVNRAMRIFGQGCLVEMLGALFLGLRGFIPDWFSVVFSDFFLLAGIAETLQGLRILDQRKTNRGVIYPLLLAVTLLTVLFYFVWESTGIRIVIFSVALSVLFGMIAWTFLLMRTPAYGVIRWTAFASSLGITFILFIRALATAVSGGKIASGSILANTLMQSILFGASSVLLTLMVVSFLVMCKDNVSEQLKELSITDALTGLFNRRAFEEIIHGAINHAVRWHEPLGLLLVDVDKFKDINDTYGHVAGDAVLKALAQELRLGLRAQDTVARFGGDEFSICLPGLNEDQVSLVAQRLAELVEDAPVFHNGYFISLRISIGQSVLNTKQPDYQDLFCRADQSLYVQKNIHLEGMEKEKL